jgi:hypothetical protein
MTSGTFTVPTLDETATDVWYRIYLTVTDAAGLVTTVFRDITPNTVNITLASSTAGLNLTLDGTPQAAPFTVSAVVGQTRAIGAPDPQAIGSTFYNFGSWSDAGAKNHNITVPASATTYTATFNPVTPFLESGGQVVMEAEHFTGFANGTGAAANATWSEQTLSGASGTVMVALPDSGVNTADTTIGPRRDYAVKFNSTGTYQVWVRLRGPTSASDSLHIGLNGTLVSSGAQGFTNGTTLAWKNTVVGTTRLTISVASAGVATINMWMREDGVQADKILLTKDSALTPSGTGPAESPHDTGTPPPSAPTLTSATGGVSQATIGWSDAMNETSYKIERKVQGAADTTYIQVGTVGQNVTTFTNTAVAAGTYTYRVKASNSGGDTVSTNTMDATVTAPPPPNAPSNLVATGGVSQAVLSWTDNSSDETGFKVERKLQTDPDTNYAQITTTAANATGFTDTVGAGNYTYRVRATNANGNSAYSNTANATVTAASVSITNLVVNDTATTNPPAGSDLIANSTQWSVQSNFAVGATAFGDRTYTISSITGSAAHLAGKPWVRPAADSKNYSATNPPVATATVNGSFVFVAIDSRYTNPTFLSNAGFVSQGYSIGVNENGTARTYNVWRKAHTSGQTFTWPSIGATTAPFYLTIAE